MIEANETFENGKSGIAKLLSMTNIVDQIACTHGLKDNSNTYQYRLHIIDFIFTFLKIFQCICSCGITLSEVVPLDYRGILIDVDLKKLYLYFNSLLKVAHLLVSQE